ncbi:MAG TPA: hypothetical protein PKE31_18000 [Pseudomonadota bacterium]|nr:hypothetical protein [Pseudomonadota bacterium]
MADPQTEHLATAVKRRLLALKKAQEATEGAEIARLEKRAATLLAAFRVAEGRKAGC